MVCSKGIKKHKKDKNKTKKETNKKTKNEKESRGDIIKNMRRSLFKPKKQNKPTKDEKISDIRNVEDCYKLLRVDNFYSNNYIEYESNCDTDKNLPAEEYFCKIKTYLKYIIINIQKSHTWKIQLTIVINFMSSKDKDRVQTMHSKNDSI